MDRRRFCGSAMAAMTGAAIGPRLGRGGLLRGAWGELGDNASATAGQAASTLRARAAAKGLIFGSAGSQGPLTTDTAYAAAFARECGILTPEAELKWGTLRPSPTTYNFAPGDWLQQWAASNNMLFRGHTLDFWQSVPGWFARTVNPGNAAQFLQSHIQTVCSHYAGKVQSWDVVNEIIDTGSGRPDGLRNSMWTQLIGPDHVADAFRWARAADPNALLVLNDFGFEYANADSDARRQAMLALLTKLLGAGVPVQALGLQTHLFAGMTAQFKPAVYQTFLKQVSDMGLKILITEMDVQDRGLPGDPASRDAQIAAIYTQVLTAALANPAVIVVETWGLSDKYSWLQQHATRSDGMEVRTLPLDDSMQPKAVYNAIGQAFDAAPPRGS